MTMQHSPETQRLHFGIVYHIFHNLIYTSDLMPYMAYEHNHLFLPEEYFIGLCILEYMKAYRKQG